MKNEEKTDETKFDPNKPQGVEIHFVGTGTDGVDMPDSVNTKILQLSGRQLFYTAIILMERAFKEFEHEDPKTDISDYMNSVFLRAELGQAFIDKVKRAKDEKTEDNKDNK